MFQVYTLMLARRINTNVSEWVFTCYVLDSQLHPCMSDVIGGQHSSDMNLGVLLYTFFRFYGTKWNYRDVAIRLTHGGSYMRKVCNQVLCMMHPNILQCVSGGHLFLLCCVLFLLVFYYYADTAFI